MAKFIKIDNKLVNIDKINYISQYQHMSSMKITRIHFDFLENYFDTKLPINKIYQLIETANNQ